MGNNQKTSFALNLLPFILSLVHMAEILHGPSNGAEKKAAVWDGLKQGAAIGISAVEANNPSYTPKIDAAISIASSLLYPKGVTAQVPVVGP